MLFFNLRATNATELECSSPITSSHHSESLRPTWGNRQNRFSSVFSFLMAARLFGGARQRSFWSCVSHRLSWSSLAQRSESTSCALRDGSSLGKPPRRVLEEEIPAFPMPASGFFGFLDLPTSRNSKNRLTRLWPNQDSEPFRRFRGTSNMVSSRLKHEEEIQPIGGHDPDVIQDHLLSCGERGRMK